MADRLCLSTPMSKLCPKCGEAIFFRYIDGRNVPLGCRCGGRSRPEETSREDTDRSETFKTLCPNCTEQVYFVRHNGGCVWLDELGDPWPKHGCFIDDGQPTVNVVFPNVSLTGIGTIHKSTSHDWKARPVFYANCTSFTGDLLIRESKGALPVDGEIVALSSSAGVQKLHTLHGAVHHFTTMLRRCRHCEDYYLYHEYTAHSENCLKPEFRNCPRCGVSVHWTEHELHKAAHCRPGTGER